MPNGNEMRDAMDFEKKLDDLHGDELGKFIARQVYELCQKEIIQEDRLKALEAINQRTMGLTGGVSGVLGAGIIAVINYFVSK